MITFQLRTMFTFRAHYGVSKLSAFIAALTIISAARCRTRGNQFLKQTSKYSTLGNAPSARTGYTFARQDRLSSYEDSITT